MRILERLCRHNKKDFDTKDKFFGGKRLELGFFLNFGQFPCSGIRIRIQESQSNADPCGFGFELKFELTQERKNLRVGSGS
jgi:hypothetical protein